MAVIKVPKVTSKTKCYMQPPVDPPNVRLGAYANTYCNLPKRHTGKHSWERK